MKKANLPIILTLARLILSPVILPLLLAYFLPLNYVWLNAALAVLFAVFGITDFFDGFLARRYNHVTPFGKILDPIADKFLIYSTLIALLRADKIYFYWVVMLIGRELFVMGLRQVALEQGLDVSVSFWGKVKTVVQMSMLFFVILNPYQAAGWMHTWNLVELMLVFAALALSLGTAYAYYQSFVCEFKKRHPHSSYFSQSDQDEDEHDDVME